MALWTPQYIDTALWLDAADSSTITLESGAVSQWADKSGNGRDAAQAIIDNRPLLISDAFNGSSAIRFDGVNDSLAVAYSYSGNAATLYAVVSRRPGGSSEQWVFSSYSGANETPLVAPMWVKGADTTQWASYANDFVGGGAVLPTDDSLFILGLDSSIYEATLDFYTNGALTAQANTGIRYTGGTARNFIGAEVNGASRFLSGSVCEIIQIESRVSFEAKRLIEGYLAHKWGLEANLPSDHPYKSAAPQIFSISGTITGADGNPASRTVRLYNRSTGAMLAETISNATTGAYSIGLGSTDEVQRIVLADETTLYNDIIDRVIPA